jgi:broad specificity phosphatase PhoE
MRRTSLSAKRNKSPVPVLYFMRHGETDFNVAHRLQGQYQTSLNARGRQQALAGGKLLRDLFEREGLRLSGFDYVSSPLNRARETMEIVRKTLGLDPPGYETDGRLMEISYGEWEGLTLPEVEAGEPGVLERREREKWDFAPPGGESYRDVGKRVADWYASVRRDAVVVAHGGVARVLMANFHIMPEADATHAEIEQGVVYVFSGGRMIRHT